MKNIDSIPKDPPSIDAEKEKLKQKIGEILDFPVFYKDRSKETDPRKLAEDPTWYPGRVSRLPNNILSEIIFVIIGERKACEPILFFKNDEDKNKFLHLLIETGVSIGDVTEETLDDGVEVLLTVGMTPEYVEKMKEIRTYLDTDRKKFDRGYGELMGVPETAINAFEDRTKRAISSGASKEERVVYNEKYSQAGKYGNFIYSKDHADEEHAYFLERNRKLQEYAPQLFE